MIEPFADIAEAREIASAVRELGFDDLEVVVKAADRAEWPDCWYVLIGVEAE